MAICTSVGPSHCSRRGRSIRPASGASVQRQSVATALFANGPERSIDNNAVDARERAAAIRRRIRLWLSCHHACVTTGDEKARRGCRLSLAESRKVGLAWCCEAALSVTWTPPGTTECCSRLG